MKKCPKCDVENPNSSKFCNNCGMNLEDVAVTTDTAGDYLNKAGHLLQSGIKIATETVTGGLETVKNAATIGKEKLLDTAKPETPPASFSPSVHSQSQEQTIDSEPATSSQGTSWESAKNPNDATSVNIKSYPFFRSDEEKTIAVIGERAADSDLKGVYQQPYAVLTQQHLYCKNEVGEFVVDTSDIQATKDHRVKIKKWVYLVWIVVSTLYSTAGFFSNLYSGDVGLALFCLICTITNCLSIFFYRRQNHLKSIVFLWVFSLLMILLLKDSSFRVSDHLLMLLIFGAFPLIYTLSVWKSTKAPRVFSIVCTGGTFSFAIDNYSSQELVDFQSKVSPFCKDRTTSFVPDSTVATKKNTGGEMIFVKVACVVLVICAITGGILYYVTHCKASGCSDPVYEDGYCKYHYALYKVDSAAHGAYNQANDFLDELFG